jgi:hypothetical protein
VLVSVLPVLLLPLPLMVLMTLLTPMVVLLMVVAPSGTRRTV